MTQFDPEQPAVAQEPQVADDVPEADALEQQAGALPEGDEESEVEPAVEADLADVEEQRRAVPLDDEDRA